MPRWQLLACMFAVTIFVQSFPDLAALGSSGTFTDDDGNVHETDIDQIAAMDITRGCGPDLYCPKRAVSREEMASFLARSLDLPSVSSGPFTDLRSSGHQNDINAIAAAGITHGCDLDRFCPDELVTREQMASFLVRAFGVPAAAESRFSDVPRSSVHASDIDAIAKAGITVGCDEDLFCPSDPVLRDQMASFLLRSLNFAPPDSRRNEGAVRLAVLANSDFDVWTMSPSVFQQERIRSLYERMVVWSPYFDERLSWYPDALAYIDLYAIYTDLDRDMRSQTHPDWILKDASGNDLYIDWGCGSGTCPQFAADIGNPQFRADFIARIRQLIETGYAGVMIDDVNMLWRISDGNGETVIPIDPRTGQQMTLADWRRYVAELVELVRGEFPDIEIMHNAIWFSDSPSFADPYIKRQIAAADWIMLERGATDEGLVGRSSTKWSVHTLFDYVDTVHRHGTDVFYLDETADSMQEQEYNLAAYLLTSSGKDLVGTENHEVVAPDRIWPGFSIDLGEALDRRYQWNGVTRRDFTGGIVLFADPESPTKTILLPVPYQTLWGETISQITLTSATAAILLNDAS